MGDEFATFTKNPLFHGRQTSGKKKSIKTEGRKGGWVSAALGMISLLDISLLNELKITSVSASYVKAV